MVKKKYNYMQTDTNVNK